MENILSTFPKPRFTPNTLIGYELKRILTVLLTCKIFCYFLRCSASATHRKSGYTFGAAFDLASIK